MSDDAFRAFTEGLARQIRAEERKRLWRLLAAIGIVLSLLLAVLMLQQRDDQLLRQKLADQCEARNVILDKQRDLYRTMVQIDKSVEHREAWAKILAELPGNRRCAEYLE